MSKQIFQNSEGQVKELEQQENLLTFQVRPAYRNEWEDAMELAWKTFLRFEAQDYSKQGVDSFKDFIADNVLYKMFIMGAYQLFAAYDNGKMIGMISLRNETHISLLFVDEEYHMKGVGRALMNYLTEYASREEGKEFVTVNSSPYALGFYHKLGFQDTGFEETNDGIRYTPMKKYLS